MEAPETVATSGASAALRKEVEILVCPETKQPLSLRTLAEAEAAIGAKLAPRMHSGGNSTPAGPTPLVLLRQDGACAYPVEDDIPILLVPEMLTAETNRRTFDLRHPNYAEAYEEMDFYNRVGREQSRDIRNSEVYRLVRPILEATDEQRASFPEPIDVWLDAVYDCGAQWDAYQHIAPIQGKRILQLGGSGAHAIKFLLGGAAETWLLTPMTGEIHCARALARHVGVADRFHSVAAVAEELPFAAESFDAIYSGGCLHHMVTSVALPEAARILRPGGKFAATDPWRAPLYAFGTKLLGKREPDVYCRPLTRARTAPAFEAFREARIVQHGTLTRYPLLALNKFGVGSSLRVAWNLNRADDAFCSLIPGLRGMGSSVVTLGTR